MKLAVALSVIAASSALACGAATVHAAPEGDPEAEAAKTPAPPTSPAPETRPAGTCLPGPAYGPQLERLALDGDALSFCRYEGEGPACYVFDLASETLRAAPVPEGEPDYDAFPGLRAPEDRGTVERCAPEGRCQRLAVPSGFTAMSGAVSASGELAALTLTMVRGGVGGHDVQVYALPSGRPVTRFEVKDEVFGCARVDFVGETLLVQLDICAGPAGRAWLADPKTGVKIADVGGPDFGAWSLHPQHVAGDRWAFREESGVEVVIQDVRTGAIAHRVDLRDTLARTDDGALDTDPSSGAMFRARDGALVVVHDAGAQGTIVKVDGATGRVAAVVKMPRCAAE